MLRSPVAGRLEDARPAEISGAKRKRSFTALAIAVPLALIGTLGAVAFYLLHCVGSWNGPAFETEARFDLAGIQRQIEADARHMVVDIGPRNYIAYAALAECERWVRERWESQGYAVREQRFQVKGKEYANLEVELPGKRSPQEIVLISAQYDTLPDSPGANNNASGMAALLALSELVRGSAFDRTLRMVAFVNEEDPFFGTDDMGSYKYAERSRRRGEDIREMVSLDAIGIFKHEHGSQTLPFPFELIYGDVGDYLGFFGDLRGRSLVIETTRGFKKGTRLPIHAVVLPPLGAWTERVAWSDHSSFWKFGYHGIMVTDTGAYRAPSHTTKDDTLDKLDFPALARISIGMYGAVAELTTLKP